MFDPHVDTLYVWVAVGAVSIAVLGVVAQLPTTAPPDGAAVATTVDEVATSPPGSVESRELTATKWSLTERRIGLRSESGTVHETLVRPVVPAVEEGLVAVLNGTLPSTVFESSAAFNRSIESARTDRGEWRAAPDRLTVRRVAWGGTDVTLVG